MRSLAVRSFTVRVVPQLLAPCFSLAAWFSQRYMSDIDRDIRHNPCISGIFMSDIKADISFEMCGVCDQCGATVVITHRGRYCGDYPGARVPSP